MITIEPMGKHHDRASFTCGVPELDRYIREQASQDVKRRISSVFIATEDTKIIGFFTLSATAISHDSLPVEIRRKLPKYPIPALLLGRLAVELSFKGKNIGKALLINAMKRAIMASNTLGIYALVVEAKNETAKSFYQHFGFIALHDHPMRLFLPLDTIAKVI